MNALPALLNGVFWAALISAAWLPLIVRHPSKETTQMASGAGISLAILTVIIGVLLHWLIDNEGRIETTKALNVWLPAFVVSTVAILVGAIVIDRKSLNFKRPERYASQGLWIARLALSVGVLLVCAYPVSRMYAYFAVALPEAEAKEALSEAAEKASEGDEGPSDTLVMASAMTAVREKLVDPGSAKFRRVSVVVQPSGMKAVCGEVNAKNRMGGYDGFEGFISNGLEKHTWLAREMDDFPTTWNNICVPKQHANAGEEIGSTSSEAIPVPSDPAATYTLISIAKKGSNRVEIVSRRNGPSGESFSRRLVNCSNLTSRYTGDGRTMDDMEASSSDQAMSSWEAGSISKEVSRFACRRAS